ncbi:MAG: family 10 glycosylhydrolase [Chitinophagaceae bacterium]|nr:family 10 glycosylhydrolase [Chitinophagaceae bacterium]
MIHLLKKYFSLPLFLFCTSLFPLRLLAQPKYEFRAVWVATVDNIDWPSSKYLSSDSQKAEFIKLLDLHQGNGMNAIIAQIRPATDAFYPSQYEPWSEWLTGTQGKPPVPYYDPLEFMITETHKRGMEFHAWMNPYRAEFKIGGSSIAPEHITKLHPEWFLPYGDKLYFDPGNKQVQNFVTNVVTDVVHRYNVDAIHFDDYFYPYRIAGKEFPDSVSYVKYAHGINKDNWRRSNVDSIILLLSRAIKKENKFCKFGISPFGVWRNIDKDPEGSNTRAGQTNYDDLYADILLWLRMKWIDYAAPQLYWEFGHKLVGYETLIDWWARHSYGRHLYIGHGIYKAFDSKSGAWKNPGELPNQIKKLREYPQVKGSIYFSSKTFESDPNGWNDSLKNNYYKYPALIPPMEWIDNAKPAIPVINNLTVIDHSNSIEMVFHIQNNLPSIKHYAVYITPKKEDIKNARIYKIVLAGNDLYIRLAAKMIPAEWNNFYLAISAVSNTNNESEFSKLYNISRTNGQWVPGSL